MALHFIIDFDDTITNGDTIGQLAAIPYRKDPKLVPPFEYFRQVYAQAASQFQAREVKNFQDEERYQEAKRAVEMKSIGEMERHRIFRGVTVEDIRAAAGAVKLRPGVDRFLWRCKQKGVAVTILSVNWTSEWIRAVVDRAAGPNEFKVVCNELEFCGGVCSGRFVGREIRTGGDKLAWVRRYGYHQQGRYGYHLPGQNGYHHNSYRGPRPTTVFIGDSRTDVLGMMASDVGVIMAPATAAIIPWPVAVNSGKEMAGNGVYRGTWDDVDTWFQRRV